MNNRKPRLLCLCLCLCIALSSLCGLPALAESAESLPEWTVMLYLCGTDLESERMAATRNLDEIFDTQSNDEVNFIIQTGGAERWHAHEVFDGLEIAADKLQRYAYGEEMLVFLDERPLSNMASAETLSEFIAWSAEHFPAKKYALVLWDHGGGSNSGIIQDELHDGAIMQVVDVARALRDGGVPLEALITDACLMATLEFAQAVSPYARYLIASEESVPGQGGAYAAWLQALYDEPTIGGAELGKAYCDGIMAKYAEISQSVLATLTYSTIDLRQIGAVNAAFDAMFTEIGALLPDPARFNDFGYDTQHTQTFEDPHLFDLMDMAVRAGKTSLSEATVNAVVQAVSDAVVYNVHGSAQTNANGLSFYYTPQAKVSDLDHIARLCVSAPYLAFLDATSMAWTAPEWVYEKVARLPDIRREDYLLRGRRSVGEDGLPTLTITNAPDALASVDVELFRYDKQRKEYLALGRDVNVLGTFEQGVFRYKFDGQWLAMNGHFCQMILKDEVPTHALYRIPFVTQNTMDELIQKDQTLEFRVGFVYEKGAELANDDPDAPLVGSYHLYGVWDGTNTSDGLPSRDVWDVSDFDGEKVILLQSHADIYAGLRYGWVRDTAFTLKADTLKFAEKTLPTGTYALTFVLKDVFGSELRTSPYEIKWDAKKKTAVCTMMN